MAQIPGIEEKNRADAKLYIELTKSDLTKEEVRSLFLIATGKKCNEYICSYTHYQKIGFDLEKNQTAESIVNGNKSGISWFMIATKQYIFY